MRRTYIPTGTSTIQALGNDFWLPVSSDRFQSMRVRDLDWSYEGKTSRSPKPLFSRKVGEKTGRKIVYGKKRLERRREAK